MVKVFVNHVDTFTGKTVGKVRENGNCNACGHCSVCPQVLSQSVVGASREQGGDEEEETGGEASGSSGNCYEVVGTLSDSSATGKPEWVTETVEVKHTHIHKQENSNPIFLQASSRDDLLAKCCSRVMC